MSLKLEDCIGPRDECVYYSCEIKHKPAVLVLGEDLEGSLFWWAHKACARKGNETFFTPQQAENLLKIMCTRGFNRWPRRVRVHFFGEYSTLLEWRTIIVGPKLDPGVPDAKAQSFHNHVESTT